MMYKWIPMTFCLLVLAIDVSAEAPDTLWTRTFGGLNYEQAWWVEETADSGFIIAGYKYIAPYGQGEDDMYVVKTDRSGNFSWEATYGDSLSDIATCIRPTGDGGYILCGYSISYPPGGTDIRVLRLDSSGDTAWAREYGGEFSADNSFGICQTLDGNFIIAGNNSLEGIQILKINASGNVLNEELIDFPQDVHRVEPTLDSGAIVVGGSSQLFLIKIDSNGDSTWSKGYGGSSAGFSVIQLADSGYAAFGHRDYSLLDDEFWLLRLDKNGDTAWTRHYGNEYSDNGYCVRETFDGGFIMAGHMFPESGTEERQIYVVRADSSGDTLWTKTIGGPDSEYAYCIQQTADSGYIVAGRTRSYGAGDYDMYLVKLAKDPVDSTGVGETDDISPSAFRMEQNYPNPFNPMTAIKFNLRCRSEVTIVVYNLLGQQVAELAGREYSVGSHEITWDGTTSDGRPASTGVYFYRLEAADLVETRKMLLLR